MTDEEKLSRYWKARTGLDWSDFDAILGHTPPNGTSSRGKAIDPRDHPKMTVSDVKDKIARLLWNGYPLSRDEYYLAIAFHFLISQLPYVRFYKTRWHENAERRAYGPEPAAREAE